MIACDFAIAAEYALFGPSEVDWGIIPGESREQPGPRHHDRCGTAPLMP